MISARLFNQEGKQTGEVSRGVGFSRAWSVTVGLFLVWAVVQRSRRDPEGQEEARRDSPLSDAVDEASILHLSRHR
jgi:hypothetical protein